MNRITLRLAAALGLLALCFAASPSSAKSARKSPKMEDPGAPAVLALGSAAPMPDVKMKNIDGKDLSLIHI